MKTFEHTYFDIESNVTILENGEVNYTRYKDFDEIANSFTKESIKAELINT